MHTLPLTHLVAQPRHKTDTRPPVLILAHGVGANERDLFELAPFADERFLVISVRAPRPYQWGGYSWFDITWTQQDFSVDVQQAQTSWETLQTFIEQAIDQYQADPQRVYLAGFSQGAIISLGATLTRPELVRGLVVMSGRWMPEIGPQVEPQTLHQKPVFVVHGAYDQVIPVRYGRAIRDFLQTLPVELSYREYPMRHEVSLESLQDITMWLTQQLNSAAHD